LYLVHHARVDQVRQGAVERRPRGAQAAIAHVDQQVVDVEVLADGENLLEDDPALARHPEPVAGEVVGETGRGLLHGASRRLKLSLNYGPRRAEVSNGRIGPPLRRGLFRGAGAAEG